MRRLIITLALVACGGENHHGQGSFVGPVSGTVSGVATLAPVDGSTDGGGSVPTIPPRSSDGDHPSESGTTGSTSSGVATTGVDSPNDETTDTTDGPPVETGTTTTSGMDPGGDSGGSTTGGTTGTTAPGSTSGTVDSDGVTPPDLPVPVCDEDCRESCRSIYLPDFCERNEAQAQCMVGCGCDQCECLTEKLACFDEIPRPCEGSQIRAMMANNCNDDWLRCENEC